MKSSRVLESVLASSPLISSVSNTSGVKGYFVSASFIPKLTKRAAVNYFEHSWYIYIIVLWLNVVISIVISHMITKPLRHVSEVTSEIAKNDFSEKFLITRHDEIGQLENNINIMSTNLENTINQLTEQLEHVQRLEHTRKQFIANFTHEIKTPLGIIAGYSELLEDATTQESREKYISIINEQIERINGIVLTMLELSRLESGKIQYEQTEVEAIALCREIVGFINGQVEDENAKVVLQTAVESQTICTDRKWLMSLLRGLLVSGEGEDLVMFYIERDEVDSMLVFRVVGTLFAQENVKDKKILIRNEINIHFIRYFGGTYTVNVETDDGPTVVFTCPLVDF